MSTTAFACGVFNSHLTQGNTNFNTSFTNDHNQGILPLTTGQFRQNVLNSSGTLFTDSLGPIKVNEFGGYIQLKKDLGE